LDFFLFKKKKKSKRRKSRQILKKEKGGKKEKSRYRQFFSECVVHLVCLFLSRDALQILKKREKKKISSLPWVCLFLPRLRSRL
jgi:hypothetical protein